MENPFQFTGTGDADLPSPDQPPPPPPPTVRRPVGRNWLLPILVPYSAFMTIAAIMYYYKYSEALQNHPLATIPDLLGDYQQKQTKGGQTRSLRMPAPDQDLPARL